MPFIVSGLRIPPAVRFYPCCVVRVVGCACMFSMLREASSNDDKHSVLRASFSGIAANFCGAGIYCIHQLSNSIRMLFGWHKLKYNTFEASYDTFDRVVN